MDGSAMRTRKWIQVQEEFFRAVLPQITDLTELKVTLHLFWRMGKAGVGRAVGWNDLCHDVLLERSLRAVGGDADVLELARLGLAKAVERGTFLRYTQKLEGGSGNWFFLNTPENQAVIERLRSGETPFESDQFADQPHLGVGEGEAQPNIFVLYEQNIGLLTPMLAEELKDAESAYPEHWIRDAFRVAVEQNKRSWRYIRAILNRWETQGKDDGEHRRDPAEDRTRYIKGRYGHVVRH
jgi:DNA replication protein